MKTFTILLAREAICTESQKRAFIGCASIVTDNRWCRFEGWLSEVVDGTAFAAAKFVQNSEAETAPTEQFLRGVAYAVTQLAGEGSR